MNYLKTGKFALSGALLLSAMTLAGSAQAGPQGRKNTTAVLGALTASQILKGNSNNAILAGVGTLVAYESYRDSKDRDDRYGRYDNRRDRRYWERRREEERRRELEQRRVKKSGVESNSDGWKKSVGDGTAGMTDATAGMTDATTAVGILVTIAGTTAAGILATTAANSPHELTSCPEKHPPDKKMKREVMEPAGCKKNPQSETKNGRSSKQKLKPGAKFMNRRAFDRTLRPIGI